MSAPDLIDALRRARRVLAITGAGVSAESGVPTYRGVAGLYNDDDGAQVMRDLSIDTMRRDPTTTFARVNQLASVCGPARPNPAHRALVACEAWCDRVAVLTQNVDGLHQLAGSTDVIEIHGSLFRMRCETCGHRRAVDRGPAEPTACACGEPLRHDVVLFGEMLPDDPVAALEALHEVEWDVCLLVGTTAMFPYIQLLAMRARDGGARLVEINPDATPLSSACDAVVRAPAGEALAPLLEPVR